MAKESIWSDIGDAICNGERVFQVMHKLGHGGFSTVWSVRSYTIDGELAVLRHLRTVAGPGHPNVVALHDSFQISGPDGEHHCLIFPVLGPSLRKAVVSAALPSSMRHQVCQQVASTMAFLHHYGVCHGVFELPDIQSMSPARVTQLLGPIKTENLGLQNGQCSPHAPEQVIQTPDLSGLDYSLLTRVRIIDFGQAFFANRPPPSLGVSIDFFSPELCFGYLPSTKSDIWHLACILY
ncbi:protein kinase domain-containing protein [Metarhizium acridum CQMa 102]|uniref:non-specific serine/threonine protein kinase n=1 Tax=Metarhizium acridum (strain CQMa 102) TaxID=655827 RepID=E9ECK1_METAQ|nr:protein kinase domain-containing protein [Metarhizium acridum CQMa 102]EFY86378.1 protein kinase domain-containing protein [Metarhizium acridum CQMa 102]